MKKLISARLAGNVLLISLGLLAIFHILVLTKLVPSNIVWGGQIQGSATNLLTLETISLLATLVFVMIIAIKMNYIRTNKFGRR